MINGYNKWIIDMFTVPATIALQEDFYESWWWEANLRLPGWWAAVARSATVNKKGGNTTKDWQLGQHTQHNKVYRPARRDDCPTVPETTEALNSSFHWVMLKTNQAFCTTIRAESSRRARLLLYSSLSIWPHTHWQSGFLTLGAGRASKRERERGENTLVLSIPTGGGGGLGRIRSAAPWFISTSSSK